MIRICSTTLAIGAMLMAVACTPAPSPAGEPSQGTQPSQPAGSAQTGPLARTSWTLVELGGRSLVPPPSRGAPTLLFDQDNRVNGFAGCNSYFASYHVEGMQIHFGEVGATRMACPGDDAMMLEQQYMEALRTVNRYERSGSTLTLFADQRTVARFRLGANNARSQ